MITNKEFQATPKMQEKLMFNTEVFVTVKPRQIWLVKEFIINGVISYTATYKNVTINFTQSRFNKLFKHVKNN